MKEKIDEAISAIEQEKIERCQEKLIGGKKIILKQKKLLINAFRKEERWEFAKCYLSDNLTSIQRMKCSSLELVLLGKQLQAKRKETFSECPLRRGIGIKTIIYIDDSIAAFCSCELLDRVRELVKNNLVYAGFVINIEKINFNSKTTGNWLGTIIDTIEFTFTVPSEKI